MSETGIDSGSDEGLEPDEDSESEADFEFGESVLGVLRKDSADEVTLLVGADRVQTFPGDRVAGVVVSKRSRMPTNYGELMTFQQMADLVSYLESLKGPS
ncbi:MAG: hypothetical protein IID37_04240 [Planctomycetes bacterium]|nr:hypothetical protein [Planctomycetota bacterium]